MVKSILGIFLTNTLLDREEGWAPRPGPQVTRANDLVQNYYFSLFLVYCVIYSTCEGKMRAGKTQELVFKFIGEL